MDFSIRLDGLFPYEYLDGLPCVSLGDTYGYNVPPGSPYWWVKTNENTSICKCGSGPLEDYVPGVLREGYVPWEVWGIRVGTRKRKGIFCPLCSVWRADPPSDKAGALSMTTHAPLGVLSISTNAH